MPDLDQQSVNLVHPSGDVVSVASGDVEQAMKAGFKVPTEAQLQDADLQAQYGNSPYKAAALGVAKSVAPFGLAEAALTGSGQATEQGLQQIEQRNPGAEMAGEVGGLLVPSPINIAKIAGKAGQGIEAGAKLIQKVAGVGEHSGLATKILAKAATKAVGGAVEGAIYSGSNVVNEAVLGDPNEAAESALANIGTGALWGAGIGGALGFGEVAVPAAVDKAKSAINGTWEKMGLQSAVDAVKSQVADKYASLSSIVSGKSKEDILAAIANRGEQVPLDSTEIAGNLQKHVDAVEQAKNTAIKDIRPEEVERLVTNVDPDLAKGEFQKLYTKLDDTVNTMRAEPELYPASYARQLEQIRDGLTEKLQGEPTSPEVYKTLNELKQTIDTKIPYEKTPTAAAQNAIGAIKDLRGAVKDSLEDTNVWGEAGARQAKFNEAMSNYLQTANINKQKGDFVKQFMYKSTGGQLKIDPTKVETFLKNTQTTKGIRSAAALADFIKNSSGLVDEIEQSYKALPEKSFDKQEVSELLAKNASVIEQNQRQAVTNRLSRGAAGGESSAEPLVAGYLAHAVGLSHPVTGAIFAAAEVLRNPVQTIQRLSKLEAKVVETSKKIIKGAKVLTKAGAATADYLTGFAASKLSPMTTSKYDKVTKEIQDLAGNPQQFIDKMHANTSSLAPHAPNVTEAMHTTGGRAISFLASKIPQRPQGGPLSPKIEPSNAELAIFNRYYNLVENPLLVMKEAASGQLTHEGVEVLTNVYPALYNKIKTEVTSQLVSGRDNSSLPYSRKMMLSLLLGQDMDGSMTPQAIQSNQALLAVTNAQNQAKDAALMGGHKARAKGLDNLSLSNQALTAQQASAQRNKKE